MTTEEVKRLTGEELDIMVAKLTGWRGIVRHVCRDDFDGENPRYLAWCGTPPPEEGEKPNPLSYWEQLPCFHSDLDAMHKVVAPLLQKCWTVEWVNNLRLVVGARRDSELDNWKLVEATARQRAEAFVLTMEGT